MHQPWTDAVRVLVDNDVRRVGPVCRHSLPSPPGQGSEHVNAGLLTVAEIAQREESVPVLRLYDVLRSKMGVSIHRVAPSPPWPKLSCW